jgi:hypothetical protein
MPYISIKAGDEIIKGELNDTPGAREFLKALPVKGFGNRWGEEFYFDIEVCLTCEQPTLRVKPGDIAFWPIGNGLALFFGKTPFSTGDDPVPASEVEIIGRMLGNFECLNCVPDGTEIVIEKWSEG